MNHAILEIRLNLALSLQLSEITWAHVVFSGFEDLE